MSVTREYQAAGKKRVNHIVARWVEGEAFDVGQAIEGQPVVRIDGMRKTGPGPVDMLLSALASCSAIDVVSILAKRRTPVASLEIDASNAGGAWADGDPYAKIRLCPQTTGGLDGGVILQGYKHEVSGDTNFVFKVLVAPMGTPGTSALEVSNNGKVKISQAATASRLTPDAPVRIMSLSSSDAPGCRARAASITSALLGSNTQSSRRSTVKGRMTLP